MLEHSALVLLLVTSADRPDVLVAACLAAMNGRGNRRHSADRRLCKWTRASASCGERAFATGLPAYS
ncbi:hypothetical protein LNP20_02445 [Klebsiella pneumoniae subsp. pneumoniae]|nr:hypothetical protein [Klebsiella pneumoniae subsp. pneumoniae]